MNLLGTTHMTLRLLLAVLSLTLPLAGISLDELKQSYLTRYDEANAQRDGKLEALATGYIKALDRELAKVQAAGLLDPALLLQEEKKAVEAGTDPLPPLPDTSSHNHRTVRKTYVDTRDEILLNHAKEVLALSDKMAAVLKDREAGATRDGRLDEALSARQMREILEQDAGIRDARTYLKFAGLPGGGRPVLRLRRFGDNIEVLVHRNRKGVVAMDSPIENVREISGDDPQQLDTAATVLGEFVGADGFEVDPWVAFDETFDGKDPGAFVPAELIARPRHEEEGEKGLRLSYAPAAMNPHGYFGQILPPLSSPGTFRFTCRYFIPRSNKNVTGFRLVQGVGGPLGARSFETSGKWETEDLVAGSSHEMPVLLFYLNLGSEAQPADAADDHVVLGRTTVEIIRFPAFVCERFDDNGSVIESVTDPGNQALFIQNGTLGGDRGK